MISNFENRAVAALNGMCLFFLSGKFKLKSQYSIADQAIALKSVNGNKTIVRCGGGSVPKL